MDLLQSPCMQLLLAENRVIFRVLAALLSIGDNSHLIVETLVLSLQTQISVDAALWLHHEFVILLIYL